MFHFGVKKNPTLIAVCIGVSCFYTFSLFLKSWCFTGTICNCTQNAENLISFLVPGSDVFFLPGGWLWNRNLLKSAFLSELQIFQGFVICLCFDFAEWDFLLKEVTCWKNFISFLVPGSDVCFPGVLLCHRNLLKSAFL